MRLSGSFDRKACEGLDVEGIDTHGGSLRVYGTEAGASRLPESKRVTRLREFGQSRGVTKRSAYSDFGAKVAGIKRDILELLIRIRRDGQRIVGYGVPGKGNTLLNYCGIRADVIDYMVDRNPYKHGRYTPGTRIPIEPPDRILETTPDFVFVMVWSVADEVVEQVEAVRAWGGRFIVAIPDVRIIE